MFKTLPDTKKALKTILKEGFPLGVAQVNIRSASGRVLAKEIRSLQSHPFFDCSAVDGYGFRYQDIQDGSVGSLRVINEIRAGSKEAPSIRKGEAVRIFTGAMVPPSVDTVVMQEKTNLKNGRLIINDQKLRKGGNIRKAGEQIRKGELALRPGILLSPSHIGFLASIGISQAKVYKTLRAAVIVTGNEIVPPGSKLKPGQIYESNGTMLLPALQQADVSASLHYCKDEPTALTRLIKKCSAKNQIVIVTGGVSVGDYDYTAMAAGKSGYRILLHGVKQKPGKPILFGTKQGKHFFGLPGNPRSVLVCFYEYVLPFIRSRMGFKRAVLRDLILPMAAAYQRKDDGKTHFELGKIVNGKVEVLKGQGSHMLRAFTEADLLLTLQADKLNYSINELVTVQLIPQ